MEAREQPTPAPRTAGHRLIVAALVILSSWIIFHNLGANSLHNGDEAKHALVAESILKTGDWLSLSYEGEPYFSKPPLRFWLAAITFRVFGISEFTTRLWSALFAVGAVLLLCLLAGTVYDRLTGLFSALILLSCPQFIYNHCAKTGELDSTLIFFWIAAMLLLLRGLEQKRSYYFSCLALGLCGMTKHLGLVAILLCIAALYLTISGNWGKHRPKTWLTGLGIILLVAVPWHLVQWLRHGSEFANAYFLAEVHGKQLTRAMKREGTSNGLLFFLKTAKDGSFPWSVLFPLALPAALAGISRGELKKNLLPLTWIAVVLLFLSLGQGRYTHYIIIAYPALALIVGRFLARFAEGQGKWYGDTAVLAAIFVIFTATSTAGQFNPFALRAVDDIHRVRLLDPTAWSGRWVITVATILIFTTALVLLRRWRSGHTRQLAWIRTVILLIIFVVAIRNVILPLKFSRQVSPEQMISQAVNTQLTPDDSLTLTLADNTWENPVLVYYVRRIEAQVKKRPLADVAHDLRKRALSGHILTTRPHYDEWWSQMPWCGRNVRLEVMAENRKYVLLLAEALPVEGKTAKTRRDRAAGWKGGPAREGTDEKLPGRWREAREHPAPPKEEIEAQLKAIGYLDGYERAPDQVGVTTYQSGLADDGLNLYCSGHSHEAFLIDMEGQVLHTWNCRFPEDPSGMSGKKKGRRTPKGVPFYRRVHLYPNGDLLAICSGRGLLRMDRDSRPIWSIEGSFHHDLFVGPSGLIHILTSERRVIPSRHPKKKVFLDFITTVNPKGEIVGRVSVLEALLNSPFADFLERGPRAGDILHTNSVELLDGSEAHRSPVFKEGNVLISMRTPSALAIIDPKKVEAVWVRRGDWLAQHEPTLLPGGRILLFDNQGHGGMSHVMEIDPFSGETAWAYEGAEGNGFSSLTCGTNQRLPNGNTLITESDSGRAFEVTPEKLIVWEFYNPARAGEGDLLIATLFDVVRLEAGYTDGWLGRQPSNLASRR